MKKIAVLVEDNYQVLEVWYPYLRLREEGFKTVLVGTGKKEYKSKEGYPAVPEVSIKDINPDDFDGVIIRRLVGISSLAPGASARSASVPAGMPDCG